MSHEKVILHYVSLPEGISQDFAQSGATTRSQQIEERTLGSSHSLCCCFQV